MASALGIFVLRQSQNDQAAVSELDRQYNARKQQEAAEAAGGEPESLAQQAPLEAEAPQSAVAAQQVQIFFSKSPESQHDPSAVFGVERSVPQPDAIQQAVSELLAGPSSTEKAAGYFGGISLEGDSNCDEKDFTLSIENGLANLRLCREHVSGGSVQDMRELSQLAATLKQFEGVTKIIILDQSGDCLFDVAGQKTCLR